MLNVIIVSAMGNPLYLLYMDS